MAWIYLAASEESLLPFNPGCDLSPTVKTTDMRSLSFCPECATVLFHELQSGTMCERCLGEWSQGQLILSTAGSPARTSALQDVERAWKESEVFWFSRCSDLLTKFSQPLFSWRMSQRSALQARIWLRKNWPAGGMTVDGKLYQLKKSELRTFVKDGSYLPTPTANSYGTNKGGGAGRVGMERPSLQTMAKDRGGVLDPIFVEWVMGYPSGWTELKGLVIAWFRPKRGKRS